MVVVLWKNVGVMVDTRGAREEERPVQGGKCYWGRGDGDGRGHGRFECSHGRTLARVGSPRRS